MKTKRFISRYNHQGARCYLFPKLGSLLHTQKKFKSLLAVLDFLLAIFTKSRLLFYSYHIPEGYTFEVSDKPCQDCLKWIEYKKQGYLFSRGEAELRWILDYPWVSTTDKSFKESYQFSSFASSFTYSFVKVYHKGNFEGFFMFSVKEGHLKTLYFYVSSRHQKGVAGWLKNFCVKNKIEVMTVYNQDIAAILISRSFPFLKVKKYGQELFSTFTQPGLELKVQDGDGDVVFT